MRIKTKAFGEMEISEKQRIQLNDGLLGFEDTRRFALLDTDKDSPFYWLQSEDIPEIAFLVIEPYSFFSGYTHKCDRSDMKSIGIEKDEDMLVLCIVTVHDNFQETTVNLLGPVIINKTNRVAKQVISTDDSYSVRHPLFTSE